MDEARGFERLQFDHSVGRPRRLLTVRNRGPELLRKDGRAGRQADPDDRRRRAALDDLRRRSLRDDAAADHHREAIREVLRLVHEVRGEQHRLAEGREVADDVPGLATGTRIEARRRLVQEQQLRVARQAERKVQAPALAARQPTDPRTRPIGQIDKGQQFVDRSRMRIVAAVEVENLGNGQVGLHARRLEHDPDALPEPTVAQGRVEPEHRHLAGVPRAVALQDLDRGGLAGPVRAEQGEDLPFADREVESGDRRHSPI